MKSKTKVSERAAREDSCHQFMHKEVVRYERKGYGLIVALLIFVGFFTGVPYFGRIVWPHLLEIWKEKDLAYTTVFLGISTSLHNLTHFGANAIYYMFYHYEFPFIERYKSNSQPWPWNEDRKRWNDLCRKSILVLFINSNVIPVFIFTLLSS